MNAIDYVLIAVIVLIFAAVGWFIYRSKKSGKKCIGCPDSGGCSGSCGSCTCGCGQKEN